MTTPRLLWCGGVCVAAAFIAGCATDSELSPKEKDRIQRDMNRQEQQQQKMMRDATGGSRTRMR